MYVYTYQIITVFTLNTYKFVNCILIKLGKINLNHDNCWICHTSIFIRTERIYTIHEVTCLGFGINLAKSFFLIFFIMRHIIHITKSVCVCVHVCWAFKNNYKEDTHVIITQVKKGKTTRIYETPVTALLQR